LNQAFDEAYIQFEFISFPLMTPYFEILEPTQSEVEGQNIMDYADDLGPYGDQGDFFIHIIPFHTYDVQHQRYDFDTPKNCFHVQGVNKFSDGNRGYATNYFYDHPVDRHKHIFVAVGTCNGYPDPQFVNQRVVNHEFGHGIRGLGHSPDWVMSSPVISPELRFSPDDLRKLREGLCVGEQPDVPVV